MNKLKKFLSEKFAATFKADSTDEQALDFALAKLAAGEITPAEYKTATAPETPAAPPAKTKSEQLAELIQSSVKMAVEPIRAEFKADLEAVKATVANADTGSVTPAKMFGNLPAGGSGSQPNVKHVKDMFSNTKSALFHKHRMLEGMPVTCGGRQMNTASDLEKAVAGAYYRMCVNSLTRGAHGRMRDLDKQLMEYALREVAWTGVLNPTRDGEGGMEINMRCMSDMERKALLDDVTSGGVEAAPIFFDDMVITTPLLFGELFPLVELVNIPRGRRIEGVTMSNPTIASHTAEGTSISLFTTTSYIGALDTTIFNAVGAMEIGMDFEEDSPINIGQIVTQKYGEAAQVWLDRVVATGNGSTEPTGIFTASGTVAVSSVNGTSGPLAIADAEQLMFGVAKQYRNTKGSRNIFLGPEVMYRRFRAVPVGTADQRRVFGMDHASYSLMDYPFKVQNDIPDGSVAYANMGYYRMYRRLGMNLRVETAGQTLALKNLMCIILRMRFGGQPTLGSAFATMEDAPTTG